MGRRAALDRGVVHGHMREIERYLEEEMASNDQQRISEAMDFLQQNAQALGEQMPHLLKGINIAARSKPDSIAKMRQEEVESILGTLSTRIEAAHRTGDAAALETASDQLSVFLTNYADAAQDGRLRTQLDQGGALAVKAFVENSPHLDVINHTGEDPRAAHHLSLIDGAQAATVAAHDADAAAAMVTLSSHISDNGVIRP